MRLDSLHFVLYKRYIVASFSETPTHIRTFEGNEIQYKRLDFVGRSLIRLS